MKNIALLGSTGSIGTQTVEVLLKNTNKFKVIFISAHRNIDLLYKQSRVLNPKYVVITDSEAFFKAKNMNFEAKVLYGMENILELIESEQLDIVLNSMVGNVGLLPTYKTVQNGIDLALANKESLVTAGHIIMKTAKEKASRILPVDSEHSAIFQSLEGSNIEELEKIILTASGGPFRNLTKEEISKKLAVDALKHPNWTMGRKISIDSATLVNKGLEVMEAKWLFDVDLSNIEVVIHPQSIIHSMVQFKDSSIIAQMGITDMKLPIHYALNYPTREFIDLPRLDFSKYNNLTFEKPDLDKFPGLKLAFSAMNIGGSMPTVYNAVNEITVEKYLNNEINFYAITNEILNQMEKHKVIKNPSIEEIIELDNNLRDKLR